MVRWLYNICFPLVFVLLLPGYLRRMVRRGNFQRNFGQRLGFYAPDLKRRLADSPPRVWVQAVSVGEMLVALKLIDALRARSPSLPLILSTTTTTGHQLAAERIGPGIELVYTPVDLRGAVRRAFAVLRPAQIVIVDGGLWPNQLWEARRRGITTALVNARLSPRSERRFRRFRRLAAAMFRLLDLVCVPEEGDVARWQSLGVPAANIRHTGSSKFDDSPASGISSPSADHTVNETLTRFLRNVCPDPDTPILLAGSTHPGEERIIAEVFLKLRQRFTRLFLIVAPRHVERTAQICSELEALGLRVAVRATAGASPDSDTPSVPPPDLLLLGTTGELRDWYALATVVFIGKSLTGVGGQNPAEAITAGRPVVFGPHMENFAELTAALLAADAAIQVGDAATLETGCARLLSDAPERQRMTDAAARQIAVHRGAASRTAALLLQAGRNFA